MVETKKDVSRPTVQNEQLCELSATEILPKKDDYTRWKKELLVMKSPLNSYVIVTV